MNYRRKGIVFTEYGSYWRNIRKLCSLELLTNSKIETYKHMRKEEVGNLIEVLKGAADARKAVCLSEMVEKVVEVMLFRMIFGFKVGRFRFKPIITEMLELVGAFNVGDYVPFPAPFDVQRLVPRMKAASKKYDEFLEKIIEEHIKDGKEQHGKARDFIHLMLSLMESDSTKGVKFGKDNIKAIILDVLGAGLDTSANAVNWAFPELLRYPKHMKRVQDELREVVGMDRMVEETDLPKLNYLNMVIKETMRLHPVAPLLVPHESVEDCTINGYFIPKKSRVLVNVWTIGRDPNVWSEDAEKFNPDRFIDVEVDIHGRDFQLIPFGSGRRICPGMNLGLLVVQLVLAQLLHCFTWELPDGVNPRNLDITEKFALTMSRANWKTALIVLISSLLRKKGKSTKPVLPQGPKGLPILGSLHMLGYLQHQDLHKLSRIYIYGLIMHIRLGLAPTIVVSSPEAAELFHKPHDLVFASRPYPHGTKYMSYSRKGIVFTDYGSYWRGKRKLCSLELLTNSKIETFRPMRKEEVGNLVDVLKGAADARKPVCFVEDMMFRMVFGFKDGRFDSSLSLLRGWNHYHEVGL
ncbi:hypothetical protein Syun_021667 [Stephania yunnanensis]|uniref:Cytochrome P450 n=1 Tax=Stephania yunnanensis TaxID=152371 RepID=A0AAP0IGT6_9MAGN